MSYQVTALSVMCFFYRCAVLCITARALVLEPCHAILIIINNIADIIFLAASFAVNPVAVFPAFSTDYNLAFHLHLFT